jgi:hypothetical protein
MKEINLGSIVTVNNKYNDYYEKEMIYVGLNSDRAYHVVVIKEEKYHSTVYVDDDEIVVLKEAKHIPIPKFKPGDIVYWKKNKVMILEKRNDDLEYFLYNYGKNALDSIYEEDLDLE